MTDAKKHPLLTQFPQMLDELKWVKLGECCQILDSQRKPVPKGERIRGQFPYYGANGIQDYVDEFIFKGTFLLVGEDGSVINKDNSPILNWAEGKIWVNNHAHVLAENREIATLRYLFYALQCCDVSDIVRGTPPKLNQANLRELSIPLPPLCVQEKIVEILDKFSMLLAELGKELEGRKKQYEYYRTRLLSFDKNADNVQWKTLGEVAEIGTGSHNTQDGLCEGTYPFYTRGVEVLRLNSFEFDEIAIITAGDGAGVGKVIHFVHGKYALHQRAYRIVPNNEVILPRFLYQYMRSTFYDYIMGSSVSSSVTSVRKPMLIAYLIPIPSLAEQERIVNILDKFEALVNDLSLGLPAEIKKVQQQYEYYRNLLLTFPE